MNNNRGGGTWEHRWRLQLSWGKVSTIGLNHCPWLVGDACPGGKGGMKMGIKGTIRTCKLLRVLPRALWYHLFLALSSGTIAERMILHHATILDSLGHCEGLVFEILLTFSQSIAIDEHETCCVSSTHNINLSWVYWQSNDQTGVYNLKFKIHLIYFQVVLPFMHACLCIVVYFSLYF